MAKVPAVNNYPTGNRFERLGRCLNKNGAAVESADWNEGSTSKFESYDGAVFSGSPDMMSEPKTWTKFRSEIDAILDSRAPILGVSFGHQMTAHAFGAEAAKDDRPVLGMVKTDVIERDGLFEGLPNPMMLLESRLEVVKSLPTGLRFIARSETSKIAAIKHDRRPLYGVQFHPERYSREHPDGNAVVKNFIRLLWE